VSKRKRRPAGEGKFDAAVIFLISIRHGQNRSCQAQDYRASKYRFKKEQQIVYPLQASARFGHRGAGLPRKKTPYYIIYLDVSDMTVMVPVDGAEGSASGHLSSPSRKALKTISEKFEPMPADWKPYQMNLDLLKQARSSTSPAWSRRVSPSKMKELPILERKLFDSALRLLVDEVSSP